MKSCWYIFKNLPLCAGIKFSIQHYLLLVVQNWKQVAETYVVLKPSSLILLKLQIKSFMKVQLPNWIVMDYHYLFQNYCIITFKTTKRKEKLAYLIAFDLCSRNIYNGLTLVKHVFIQLVYKHLKKSNFPVMLMIQLLMLLMTIQKKYYLNWKM